MVCAVCCFFFVKQKTAYELRISDWSSDVCSSDLEESDGVFPALPASSCEIKESGAATMSDERNWVDLSGHGFSVRVAEFARPPGSRLVFIRGDGPQIGRPSCRERVCPYV